VVDRAVAVAVGRAVAAVVPRPPLYRFVEISLRPDHYAVLCQQTPLMAGA